MPSPADTMMTHPIPARRICLLLLSASLWLMPAAAASQTIAPTLFLRPHCEDTDQTACPLFAVRDPSTLVTPALAAGDALDIDIILSNPAQDPVTNLRMWLSYDTSLLEGTAIALSSAFPTPVEGETEFDAVTGYVKIAASAVPGQEPADMLLPVARITFTMKPGVSPTPGAINFYDQRNGTDGHTFVATLNAPGQNLVTNPLGSLLVQSAAAQSSASSAPAQELPPVVLNGPDSVPGPTLDTYAASSSFSGSGASASVTSTGYASLASSASGGVIIVTNASAGSMPLPGSSVSSESPSSSSSSLSSSSSVISSVSSSVGLPGGPQASFGLLQVKNIRISTKDSALYVTWDALIHPKLQGYNIYYGTMQGRYLQRRSASVAARGTVIRDLDIGKTYYVAVRAVDDLNQETAFSAEVSVEVGNPGTASSPIDGSLESIDDPVAGETVAPHNPVENTEHPLKNGVPGKSGAPSAVMLLLFGAAAIGTLFACRRQYTASIAYRP